MIPQTLSLPLAFPEHHKGPALRAVRLEAPKRQANQHGVHAACTGLIERRVQDLYHQINRDSRFPAHRSVKRSGNKLARIGYGCTVLAMYEQR